jgi:hypothetical protein
MRWNLDVILIFIFFMARDVEQHFFRCILSICTSFKNCLLNSHARLLIGLLVLLEFSFFSSYIFWLSMPCQMNSWHNFFPFCRLSLHSSDYFLCFAETF